MKTKLNILCILIFVAIGASIVETAYGHLGEFLRGVRDGMEMSLGMAVPEASSEEEKQLFFIALEPTNYEVCTDSVYNVKTGEWMSAQLNNIVVDVDESSSPWWRLAILMVGVMIVTAAVMLQIIVFCQLIYTINKSIIFEWQNVFKLRLIGWAMLAYFLTNALCTYVDYVATTSIIDIPNYKIITDGMWDFYQLILGLGILLVAEIFAVGLRLREEQELTI